MGCSVREEWGHLSRNMEEDRASTNMEEDRDTMDTVRHGMDFESWFAEWKRSKIITEWQKSKRIGPISGTDHPLEIVHTFYSSKGNEIWVSLLT